MGFVTMKGPIPGNIGYKPNVSSGTDGDKNHGFQPLAGFRNDLQIMVSSRDRKRSVKILCVCLTGPSGYCAIFSHPPHLPNCPQRDKSEDKPEKTAAWKVEPKEGRRYICLQPHRCDIDYNANKREYNQPGARSAAQIQK
jgi:hypothetical protein